MPSPVFFSIGPVSCSGRETDGAGRVMERQPGMSRETTDRERSVLFVQVCMCVSASSTLPARQWLWDWNVVPVRAFLKSETHWHFKRTGDISVANSALFSFYYWAPLPDFPKTVSGDVFPNFPWNRTKTSDIVLSTTRFVQSALQFRWIYTHESLTRFDFAICWEATINCKILNGFWAQQKSCGDTTIQGLLNNEQNVSQRFAFCTRDRMAPVWFREIIIRGRRQWVPFCFSKVILNTSHSTDNLRWHKINAGFFNFHIFSAHIVWDLNVLFSHVITVTAQTVIFLMWLKSVAQRLTNKTAKRYSWTLLLSGRPLISQPTFQLLFFLISLHLPVSNALLF